MGSAKAQGKEKAMEEILNFTSESMDSPPTAVAPESVGTSPIVQIQPDTSNTVAETIVSLDVQQPELNTTEISKQ